MLFLELEDKRDRQLRKWTILDVNAGTVGGDAAKKLITSLEQ